MSKKYYLIMDYDQEVILSSLMGDELVWSNAFLDYEDTIDANYIDEDVIFTSLEETNKRIEEIKQLMLKSGIKKNELDIRPLEVAAKITFVLTKPKYNLL